MPRKNWKKEYEKLHAAFKELADFYTKEVHKNSFLIAQINSIKEICDTGETKKEIGYIEFLKIGKRFPLTLPF